MMSSWQQPGLPRGYTGWLAVVKNYQKCHRLLSRALEPLGLSVAQHEVLIAISRQEGMTQQALAEHLLVVKSNISGLLRRLEGQGLVRREIDPGDARNKRLSLTRSGRRLARRSFEIQARIVETMMGAMDDDELRRHGEMARRIGDVLDEQLTGGD